MQADVIVAAVQDRATRSVTHGENAGRTLTHVAVVRWMSILGSGDGRFNGRTALDAFRSRGATQVVAFVQERGAGPVHAVESVGLL